MCQTLSLYKEPNIEIKNALHFQIFQFSFHYKYALDDNEEVIDGTI